MDSITQSVARQLTEISPKNREILVAASGGPDSQCLLNVIGNTYQKSGIEKIVAVGVDHGLRNEAPQELVFAEELASQHAIPFHTLTIQIPSTGNLMEQAREGRYAALRAFARSEGLSLITTGHTASDQAETILFNLARGAGPRGAVGMKSLSQDLFRPLLDHTRDDIIAYLATHNIPFSTDPTNHNERFSRPQLRHKILPLLTRINSSATENIHHFAKLARKDNEFLDQLAREEMVPRVGILDSLDLKKFQSLASPIASRILMLWLEKHGISTSRPLVENLESALASPLPWKRSITRTQYLEISHKRLWCAHLNPYYELSLQTERCIAIPNLSINIAKKLLTTSNPKDFFETRKKIDCTEVSFDAAQLHPKLLVRSWLPGDRLNPFGSNGHITIGDLFTNAKIPKPMRKVWPLVISGKDIIWVPGIRRANLAPITSASQKIVSFKLNGNLWASTD